jgi:hypothetical protein
MRSTGAPVSSATPAMLQPATAGKAPIISARLAHQPNLVSPQGCRMATFG